VLFREFLTGCAESRYKPARADGQFIAFTKNDITIYFGRIGLENCRVRRQKMAYAAIAEYHHQGLLPGEIAERMNKEGIKPYRVPRFTIANIQTMLRTLRLGIQPQGKEKTSNWDFIRGLLDQGLSTKEILTRLNEAGLTTKTGAPYDYEKLYLIARRKGYKLPPASLRLPAAIKERLVSLHREGKSCREAYEILRAEGVIDLGRRTRGKIINFYQSLHYPGIRSEHVPKNFVEAIEGLVLRGLTATEIAEELNGRGEKPIRADRYTGRVVYKYCYALGISLPGRTYDLDSELMELVNTLHAAGKSCREIAVQLNRSKLVRFGGGRFNTRSVWEILTRRGKVPIQKDPAEHIMKEIQSLADRGYSPGAMARNLNSMGLTSVTGQRFKKHHVTYYLQKLKAKAAEGKESVAQAGEEAA